MPDILAPVTQREKYAYPLLLFLLCESLIYLVFVEGYNNHQLFTAYTIVLCLALATTHLQLVLRVYVSNLIVGSISILFMVYNTYFLTEITDPTWLKLLFLDIQASFDSLWNGKMYAEETVITLLGMCVVWFIAHRSLKAFVRQRRIMVLFLAGLILQGILFSYVQRTFSAANVIYMIAGLLLLSLSRLANLEEAWERQGVRGGGDIVLNWAGKAVALICMVAAIGTWLPSSQASILQDNAQLRRITDWVKGSRPVGGDVNEADPLNKDESKGKNTSFGWSDKTLGGPWKPDKALAMTVVSPRESYWRGGAKEIYNGQGWENARLPAGNAAQSRGPAYQGIKTEFVEQTMRMSQQFAVSPLLFGATMPKGWSGLNKSTEVDENGNIWVRGSLGGGDTYRVLSEVPLVEGDSLQVLRGSGDKYPEDITRLYLQLPKLPERVKLLAQQITAGKNNPYDKAKALADYFNEDEAFVYDLNPQASPPGQDFVDYFLFTGKRGYCTYYSSAMAVMARSIGLPSRWVTGYTSGETNDKSPDTYHVTGANQHAWVEIYFANVGWIPFEPTKGFRLPGSSLTSEVTPNEQNIPNSPETAKNRSGWSGVLLVIFFLGVGVIVWVLRARRKNSPEVIKGQWLPGRRSRRRIILLIYRNFLRLMEKAGVMRAPSQTPREFAARNQIPELAPPVNRLTRIFEAARYGESMPDDADTELAGHDFELIKQQIYPRKPNK